MSQNLLKMLNVDEVKDKVLISLSNITRQRIYFAVLLDRLNIKQQILFARILCCSVLWKL